MPTVALVDALSGQSQPCAVDLCHGSRCSRICDGLMACDGLHMACDRQATLTLVAICRPGFGSGRAAQLETFSPARKPSLLRDLPSSPICPKAPSQMDNRLINCPSFSSRRLNLESHVRYEAMKLRPDRAHPTKLLHLGSGRIESSTSFGQILNWLMAVHIQAFQPPT